ncbi:phosphate acetyltransferase [Spongiivirga citrea]|uniref:Phosphate acetyltransferase n=1 Tax=Spongiivirga citrea TaxID=1481457 RepID=A0A6M0CK82_9FLAO|nr:phosphate acetyltransferase [Spongiivirga citrea]NER15847.1 phosphate acetyltransferase [Spongiivirga citrea]
MSKAVYVATIEPHSGKSLVVLGLMRMLLGTMPKVGYFRPIVDNFQDGEMDNHINTIIDYFKLDQKPETAYGFTRSQIRNEYNQGHDGEVQNSILHKFKQLEEVYDFVLVEGSDFSDEGNIMEFDLNAIIARNLGIPTIIVASGAGNTKRELTGSLQMAYDTFSEKDVNVIAVFANKINRDQLGLTKEKLNDCLPDDVAIFTIPTIDTLGNPTIKEIVQHLNGKVLFGEKYLNNQTGNFGVGAMNLPNYLTKLKDKSLVITPGDRADIILGALQAHSSSNYPEISGIILTGGLIPEDSILKLIEGASSNVPIVSVEGGTFGITNAIGNIKSRIYAESTQKIETSLTVFDDSVNVRSLSKALVDFKASGISPQMFLYNLQHRAKKSKKHIVLPEGEDDRIIEAAAKLVNANIVDITLIGDEKKIRNKVALLQIDFPFNKIPIITTTGSANFDDYVNTFYELRKHKQVNMDMAKDFMTDVSYFGTMMVYKGHADGMVSGAVHTTQHTIRPALQFVKTRPGVSVVSSVFFMCLEDRVSVFGDCAINPNPNAEQLAEIAISSAESSINFGIEPKIAMLSYSSGASGKGADVEIVREATQIVKLKRPDLKIEGPIQYDAAVDKSVGAKKLPNSQVAGQASVLIFPDLNTGNNTYKAVQRETGALAIGPMLQGLNKPVNDLSRGCTTDDVFNTVIITAIQAQDA